jgi:protein phosphatase methylesterase 1
MPLLCAASLPSMTGILKKRPTTFSSPKDAITWVTEHNMSRSHRAASISVPSQLAKAEDDTWQWRTPLLKSEPFWEEWYLGLSEAFLAVQVPKVLMLAGADRLDRPLTIAQMQGKFQALLVPNAGHAVHEDEAHEVVKGVRHFIQRFRIGVCVDSLLCKATTNVDFCSARATLDLSVYCKSLVLLRQLSADSH